MAQVLFFNIFFEKKACTLMLMRETGTYDAYRRQQQRQYNLTVVRKKYLF